MHFGLDMVKWPFTLCNEGYDHAQMSNEGEQNKGTAHFTPGFPGRERGRAGRLADGMPPRRRGSHRIPFRNSPTHRRAFERADGRIADQRASFRDFPAHAITAAVSRALLLHPITATT